MSFPMQAAAAGVLILGLAVGSLMGRGTWQRPAPPSSAIRQGTEDDPLTLYNLDYLTDTPRGSLALVYLTLASTKSGQGE